MAVLAVQVALPVVCIALETSLRKFGLLACNGLRSGGSNDESLSSGVRELISGLKVRQINW